MSQLKVLYLHDNLLSSYNDIKSLSYIPSLEILSLYDSPLSLKRNYRHHAVNSIWTLKVKLFLNRGFLLFQLTIVVFHQALDSHVIADDEIIEKTHFREPYAVYSNSFKLNIYIPTGKVRRKMHN